MRSRGAEVVLAGDTYADAYAFACDEAARTGATFIHPFDDLLVIAGQGTVGDEIVRQRPGDLDAIFIPVGGGGLLAGIAAYVKAVMPAVRIIGVEPVDADAMARSLEAGHRVALDRVGLFADGVAVREVGEHTFAIACQTVDEMVLVDNDAICAAIKDVFDDTRTIMEPAGALSVAGLKAWVGGAARAAARAAGRRVDRRQHELRSPALRRRARRTRRAAGGALRRDHPGAQGRVPASSAPSWDHA